MYDRPVSSFSAPVERGALAGNHVGADRTLLDAIVAAQPRLRRSEQKVAQAVLDDPHKAVHASMAGLARASGVSEPTVMRFCTAVDCDSFQGFKLRLAQSLAFGVPATYSTLEPMDGPSELVEKIFDYTISSLAHARRQMDDAVIGRAIDVLIGATELLFLGFGASGIVAQDAQQKFPLFGKPCMAPGDAHQQFMAASLCHPGSAIVAISHTGTTLGLLQSVEAGRENGATIIGISGARTPLLERSDVPIVVETLENTDLFTPTISRIAQLAVIDVLATGVLLRQPPDEVERVRAMKSHVSAMRTGRLDHVVELSGADGDGSLDGQ
jgi:RpiR family carbohydrate utilization transcriptional regulator